METIEDFLSTEEERQLIDAIRLAELSSSGEIRIHLENSCQGPPYERAQEIFLLLGMNRTQLRNGVLIYVAVSDHCFAVCGDTAYNEVVTDQFWNNIKDEIHDAFEQGNFLDGLKQAVHKIGLQLKDHFPWNGNDINELPDNISRS